MTSPGREGRGRAPTSEEEKKRGNFLESDSKITYEYRNKNSKTQSKDQVFYQNKNPN
jgi:hypothetical protein